MTTSDALRLAVRVYPESPDPLRTPYRSAWRRPDMLLVFDTETRIDTSQRLTFGSYRIIIRGRCVEEAEVRR